MNLENIPIVFLTYLNKKFILNSPDFSKEHIQCISIQQSSGLESKAFLQQWKISILSILRISLVYLDKSIKGIPGRLDLELGLAVCSIVSCLLPQSHQPLLNRRFLNTAALQRCQSGTRQNMAATSLGLDLKYEERLERERYMHSFQLLHTGTTKTVKGV